MVTSSARALAAEPNGGTPADTPVTPATARAITASSRIERARAGRPAETLLGVDVIGRCHFSVQLAKRVRDRVKAIRAMIPRGRNDLAADSRIRPAARPRPTSAAP